MVRIYDICGHATAKQIYVNAISNTLLPASIFKTCDKLHLAYPTSLYYQYKWTRPNKTTFIKDNLVLDPINPSDTGTYQIAQIININGCRDTLYASYHASLSGAKYTQHKNICPGNTATIGTKIYTTSGVYTDTLVNNLGCDSIIQLTLQVSAYKNNTIDTTICEGQTIFVGTLAYTLSGIYHDTLTTSTCDSIIILHLYISSPSLDLGKDTSICQGQSLFLNTGKGYTSYYWNNNYLDSVRQSIIVNNTGSYWVKVENSIGCKAIDTRPIAYIGKDTSICLGNTFPLMATGGAQYQWLQIGNSQSTVQVSPQNDKSYQVIVSDLHGCSDTAEIMVRVKPAPTKQPFDQNSQTHCFEDGPIDLRPSWGDTF